MSTRPVKIEPEAERAKVTVRTLQAKRDRVEPITMLTDVLVTVVCWYAFHQLGKMEHKGSIHRLARGYFLTMGMATLLGGLIGHSFNYALSIYWKIPGWYVSMFSCGPN